MELEYAGRRFALAGGELIVGSDPGSGIVLEELRPRHAAVRPVGPRMATIRPLEEGATIKVNGVPVGREAMPLMDGDRVQVGPYHLLVVNPAHPPGGPDTPPSGARQQLHDTLFGVPKHGPPPGDAPAPPSRGEGDPRPPSSPGGPTVRGGKGWIIAAAVVTLLALLAFLLL